MSHSRQTELVATKLVEHFRSISRLIEKKQIDAATFAIVEKALDAAQTWTETHVAESLTRDDLLDAMDELELQLEEGFVSHDF